MNVIEPGHVYELPNLCDPGHQTLTFIKRSSGAIDYKDAEHPGTNTQSVLRALIDRTKYLDDVLEAEETQDAVYHLRMALFVYEARAWRRKQQKLNGEAGVSEPTGDRYDDVPFSEWEIEKLPVGEDGHVVVQPPSKKYKGQFPKLPLNIEPGQLLFLAPMEDPNTITLFGRVDGRRDGHLRVYLINSRRYTSVNPKTGWACPNKRLLTVCWVGAAYYEDLDYNEAIAIAQREFDLARSDKGSHPAGSLRINRPGEKVVVATPHSPWYSTVSMLANEFWDQKTDSWQPICT